MSAAKPFEREKRSGADARAAGMPVGPKRVIIYLCVAAAVFVAGFVPMWLKARSSESQLSSVRRELRLSTLENRLAAAAVDARRGDYEPARQQASDFFSALRAQTDSAEDSSLDARQREALAPLLEERDETITLLARSDPASADRLSDMYASFRQRMTGAPETGQR
jgi:hypothetical protein